MKRSAASPKNLSKPDQIDKNDISCYHKKSSTVSDTELFDMIQNVYKPEKSFKFPKRDNKRKFRYKWLEKFEWLKYSLVLDGGFCLPCSLFSHRAPPRFNRFSNLVSKPVFASAESTTIFKQHESSRNGLHAFCLQAF